MPKAENSFILKIADLNLQFCTSSEKIQLDKGSSVKHFCISALEESCVDYKVIYYQLNKEIIDGFNLVFAGNPEGNDTLNYKWLIYSKENTILIRVIYSDHDSLKSIAAKMSNASNIVEVFVEPKNNTLQNILIDPLIHPFGTLMLLYLVLWKRGLLIHASGVIWNDKVLLFTGVSGIGKSTMAKLWSESGAQIINDDRLILMLTHKGVKVYNNPMPYYQQYPRDGKLKGIFILKQAKENYIKKLSGVKAYASVLGNFIQQFYDSNLVESHLGLVHDLLLSVSVTEVGFKPDQEIVDMIKNYLES